MSLRLLAAATLLLAGSAIARADSFQFVSQSAIYNPGTQVVTFTIQFNQAPDFVTLDSAGRQHDSFQYFVVGDPSKVYPADYDSIIRGEELHNGRGLPIRNVVPPSSDPSSGGWGSVRGTVGYDLTGNTLTFSTPLGLVSDHSTDGIFSYELLVTEYGSTTQDVVSQSTILPSVTAVPEPSSMVLLGTGLLGIAGTVRRRFA